MRRQSGATSGGRSELEAALPFGVAFGHRLRQVREEAGLTGEQMAFHVQLFGLGWDRTTVTRIELGQRQLTAAELLVLPLALDRPLADLLPTESVSLTDSAAVGPEELRRGLTEPHRLRAWYLPLLYEAINTAVQAMPAKFARVTARFPDVDIVTLGEAGREGWTDEATTKAARRLGVDREDVAVAAQEIWSRGLAAERDRRLAETGGDGGTPRAQQARRGHITRALLDELRPAVEEIQRGRATTKKGSV